jgi:hypothetical protein
MSGHIRSVRSSGGDASTSAFAEEEELGNEDASTLSSMNQVGLALDDQGKYEEAEQMYR